MSMSSSKIKQSNIFGFVQERNVIFLVDISGSMYHCLESVKEHLIKHLNERTASFNGNSLFNIIAFSDEVSAWTNKGMPCTARTVPMAIMWIRHLRCKTTSNTLDALMLAFEDDSVDAIYMVTDDGLSDKKPSIILDKVSKVFNGRPVHCICINGPSYDNRALDFLERLAEQTKGTLHCVSFTAIGTIKETEQLYPRPHFSHSANSMFINESQFNRSKLSPKTVRFSDINGDVDCGPCNFLSDLPSQTQSTILNGTLGDSVLYDTISLMETPNTFVPVPKSVCVPKSVPVPKSAWGRRKQENKVSDILAYADAVISSRGMRDDKHIPVAASLMIGRRILVKGNGSFYYLGRIVEVSPSEIFTVEFDKCPELHGLPLRQENLLKDIISFEDSSRHSICVADKVLVPLLDGGGKYVPGTVIEEISRRIVQKECYDRKSFYIALCSGETMEVDSGVACWIPNQDFEKSKKDMSSQDQINDITSPIPHWLQNTQKGSLSAHVEEEEKRAKSPIDKLQRQIDKQLKEGAKYWLQDTWKGNSYSPVLTVEKEEKRAHSPVDIKLQRQIDKQMKEGEYLLNNLHFDDNAVKNNRLVALKQDDYFRHNLELLARWDKREQPVNHHPSIVQEEKPKKPVNHHPSIEQEEKVCPKPKKPYAKKHKRCRTWTGGKLPHPPEIRATNLSRSANPKSRKLRPDSPTDLRPEAAEYHTSDGVPFPSRTDRKFDTSYLSKSWTLSDGCNNRPMQRSHDIITNKATRPIYDSPGKKEEKQRPKQKSWNCVRQQREEKQENDKYMKDKLHQDREENHRANIERREKDRADNLKSWKESENRMKLYKQEIRENVEKFYKEKEEAAQTHKYDRLDAMRQQRAQYNSKETDREQAARNERLKLKDSLTDKEQKRRNLVHEKLEKEINDQEIKLERLRKIQEKRTEREFKRTTNVRGNENLRSHVNELDRNIHRAGILP